MECTAAVSCCFGLRHRDCIVFLCASPFRYLRGYMPGLWRMYAVACPYWAPRLFCYAGIDDDWPRMGKNHLFFAEHSILAGGWIHSRRHS